MLAIDNCLVNSNLDNYLGIPSQHVIVQAYKLNCYNALYWNMLLFLGIVLLKEQLSRTEEPVLTLELESEN